MNILRGSVGLFGGRNLRGLMAMALIWCAAGLASAASASLLPNGSNPYLTFQLDNDLFNKTDNDYTNGARLSWVSATMSPKTFNQLQKALLTLAGDRNSFTLLQALTGFREKDQLQYKYGFSLTQLMYTPTDLQALVAPPGQRPYAGWLGLGFSIHVQDSRTLNTVEFSLGTIGSNSFAHEAQDFIHDARAFEKFQGWDSQLENEVTGNLFFTQSRRWREPDKNEKLYWDGFWEWGFAAGTFRTDVMIGGIFRVGWNLPVDFSDPRLSLRSYTHQAADLQPVSVRKNFSFYGQVGFRHTAVLHDSTLDGSLFRRDHTGVSSELLVEEYYIGAGIRYCCFELSYVDTYRTREFREQADGQKFGSVTLRIRF